jgi:hypothetical protein
MTFKQTFARLRPASHHNHDGLVVVAVMAVAVVVFVAIVATALVVVVRVAVIVVIVVIVVLVVQVMTNALLVVVIGCIQTAGFRAGSYAPSCVPLVVRA